jgi:hypothetical protein
MEAPKKQYEIYRDNVLISTEKASRAMRKFGKGKFIFDVAADIDVGDKLINAETKDEYFVTDKETRNGGFGRSDIKFVSTETKAEHDRKAK